MEHVTMLKNQTKFKDAKQLKKDYDNVFSWYIRTRDGWKCQRCGTEYAPPTKVLQCSHYENRANMATRFYPPNCMAACNPCHAYHLEGKKHGEYTQIMQRRMNDTEYNLLLLKIDEGKARPTKFSRGDYICMIAMCVKDLKELAVYSPYKTTIIEHTKKWGGIDRA